MPSAGILALIHPIPSHLYQVIGKIFKSYTNLLILMDLSQDLIHVGFLDLKVSLLFMSCHQIFKCLQLGRYYCFQELQLYSCIFLQEINLYYLSKVRYLFIVSWCSYGCLTFHLVWSFCLSLLLKLALQNYFLIFEG